MLTIPQASSSETLRKTLQVRGSRTERRNRSSTRPPSARCVRLHRLPFSSPGKLPTAGYGAGAGAWKDKN